VADTEAEAGTEPGLGVLVVVLDDIHSPCLHLAYFQVVVKGIRRVVEEAVAALPPAKRLAANSSSVYELDSWELEAAILMSSWSASALEAGHRKCSRKLPPARSSKHVHTGLDEVHQNVLDHIPPYFQLILDVPTSPVLPHSSGRCWDFRNTQAQR
jgi:hypothetical protein